MAAFEKSDLSEEIKSIASDVSIRSARKNWTGFFDNSVWTKLISEICLKLCRQWRRIRIGDRWFELLQEWRNCANMVLWVKFEIYVMLNNGCRMVVRFHMFCMHARRNWIALLLWHQWLDGHAQKLLDRSESASADT